MIMLGEELLLRLGKLWILMVVLLQVVVQDVKEVVLLLVGKQIVEDQGL